MFFAGSAMSRGAISAPNGAPYRIVATDEGDTVEVFAQNTSNSKYMVHYQLSHVSGGWTDWANSGGKRCYPGDKALLSRWRRGPPGGPPGVSSADVPPPAFAELLRGFAAFARRL